MAKRKAYKTRTAKKDWRPIFLKELTRTGNVSAAVIKAKIGRQTAYDARASDPHFSGLWIEAVAIADEMMEAEARRRAVEGTLRPVFQGGKTVGKIREYSDTLLIFLLKAHKPEKYRDNSRVIVAGDPSSPIKHGLSFTDQIDQLAVAFERAANRASESGFSQNGTGKHVDS